MALRPESPTSVLDTVDAERTTVQTTTLTTVLTTVLATVPEDSPRSLGSTIDRPDAAFRWVPMLTGPRNCILSTLDWPLPRSRASRGNVF